jgi:hypothetical protein
MQFFKRFCDGLKLEMAEVVVGLIEELNFGFLEQLILDAMGVVILNIGCKQM